MHILYLAIASVLIVVVVGDLNPSVAGDMGIKVVF